MSDIHFHGETYGWDANSDQRDELSRDLAQIVLRDGPIDALLVGGDIAFSASPEEYDIAARWISDLVAVCGGIDNSAVWTVPGNHDVSWAVLGTCEIAKDFRTHLRQCTPEAVDETLRARMSSDPAAASLFIPLSAYNSFAAKFLCESSPAQPHWSDDTTLVVDGWPVRLTGLNSALTSDWADHEHQASAHLADAAPEDPARGPGLVLGTEQCRLPRTGNPIHVVMAHHPPSWIRDWKIVEPYLRRAHLWLFGHEHEYRAEQDVPLGTVFLAGGAVGPERDESGEREPYVPAYSVITLARTETEALSIKVLPRYWSMAATRFVEHPTGSTTFEVSRDPALTDTSPATAEETSKVVEVHADGLDDGSEPERPLSASSASPLAVEVEQEGSTFTAEIARPDLRRLATQFMTKPATQRVAIGLDLGVIEDGDLSTGNRDDLFRVILRRVREQGLIEELSQKMGPHS